MEAIARVQQRIAEIQQQVVPANTGAFQAQLDHAIRTAAPAGAVRPPVLASGGWVNPVPGSGVVSAAELESFLARHGVRERNGRLEGSGLLVEVSGGWEGRPGKLLAPAAQAWERMREAAARDGIDLRAVDFYRSWETQARAHEAHLAGHKHANVLPPGRSEHGNGLAVDISNGAVIGHDDREWAWMQANASRFGWFPISNETWHWEFRGVGA